MLDVDSDEGRIEVAFEGTEAFTNPFGEVLGGFLAAMLYDKVGPALLATFQRPTASSRSRDRVVAAPVPPPRPGHNRLEPDAASGFTVAGMDTIAPEITRDIYPMPAFVTLVAADVARTVDWYVNGLGFISLFTMPGPDGEPALVHLRRWRYQDILVRPGQPTDSTTGSAGEGWTVSVMASAEELDALANRARAHGGGTTVGPYDTPWNTRDLRTADPDGYPLVFTARRPMGERDERFSAMITRQAGQHGLRSDKLGRGSHLAE